MKPRFDFTLSFGNVLTALAVLFAFVTGYVKLQLHVQEHEAAIGRIEVAITATNQQIARVATMMQLTVHDLKSFPMHRHIPGGAIVYPAASDRQDPVGFLEQHEGVSHNQQAESNSGQALAAEPKKSKTGGGPSPPRRKQRGP